DPGIRSLYRKLLMEAGYFSIEAGDSQEVFQFLKDQIKDIDVVILDIAMPRISGLTFYEMIRTAYPNAKVIVASVFSEDQQKYFLFGANEYFDKSASNEAFLYKVEK